MLSCGSNERSDKGVLLNKISNLEKENKLLRKNLENSSFIKDKTKKKGDKYTSLTENYRIVLGQLYLKDSIIKELNRSYKEVFLNLMDECMVYKQQLENNNPYTISLLELNENSLKNHQEFKKNLDYFKGKFGIKFGSFKTAEEAKNYKKFLIQIGVCADQCKVVKKN